jgi:hypothetical protein
MTVAWTGIKDALSAFVRSTGVVASDHVVWDRGANETVFHESTVELRITGERSLGYDDVEDVELSPGIFAPRVTGIREFTLSIRFRARSEADAYAARHALETLRASFHHPVREQILSDAGVSFLETEMLETRDIVLGGRTETIAALDVRLGVLSELFDTSLDAQSQHLNSVGVSVNGALPFTVE